MFNKKLRKKHEALTLIAIEQEGLITAQKIKLAELIITIGDQEMELSKQDREIELLEEKVFSLSYSPRLSAGDLVNKTLKVIGVLVKKRSFVDVITEGVKFIMSGGDLRKFVSTPKFYYSYKLINIETGKEKIVDDSFFVSIENSKIKKSKIVKPYVSKKQTF